MAKRIIKSNIFIFLIILFMVAPIILSRNLNNLDEIWNYNFARNVANGLIPYKDFNMVTTPLLPFVCAIFLRIFGNELIVMRILAIFLISIIYFLIYLILKKLNINKLYIFTCLFLLFTIFKNYICIDYNFAVLAITLFLIYLELSFYMKNKNYFNNSFLFYFLVGILASCCILLKQTTGIMITLASILYPVLFIKNKLDFKKYIKISTIKILGVFIPIAVFVIYLIITNSFTYFIDYAILGIKTFSNNIPYTRLLNSKNLVEKTLSIFMPIFIIVSGYYILAKKDKKLIGFYFYSIASLAVIFPISDSIHFLIGFTSFIILLYYLFYEFIGYIYNKLKAKNFFENKITAFFKKFFIALITECLAVFIIFQIISIKNYLNNTQKIHSVNHYSQIPISENLQKKINIIQNYIISENNNVYILDSEAAIYMISLDKYNKDFDMFNKGNLGSKSEKGIIEEINNFSSGTKLLIKNNKYSKNWQTPMEVIKYIENNFSKIGEISIFDIYEI